MGGSSKSSVVGYHYRLALHVGLMRGEADKFMEFRAADKTAWQGTLTGSGRIQINAPDLFGGEKDQGGIVGPIDVMFGEADQLPNAYLRSVFGNQIVAWRGFTTLAFCGGRYGAMSPFAQKFSVKVAKIINGWDGADGNDLCWYPETAAIPLGTGSAPEGIDPTSGGWRYLVTSNSDTADYSSATFDDSAWSVGASPFASSTEHPYVAAGGYPDVIGTSWPINQTLWARRIFTIASPSLVTIQIFVDNWATVWVNGTLVLPRVGSTTAPSVEAFLHEFVVPPDVLHAGNNVIVLKAEDYGSYSYAAFRVTGVAAGWEGMNPAHTLLYVQTDSEMGREPRANVDEVNLTAAADRLYAEGLGLCWEFNPESDTPDSFNEKVCRIIAGSFERSLVDGKWRLNLLRPDYDFDTLPIMSDSDGPGGGLILSYKELPSTLDSAVNCVGVRYFDIERKESRTIWARAPGLIRQFGEFRELLDFRWVPTSTIAARIAERELRTYITPRRSFEITTDPSYRGIERYQTVRFQTAKRGIADMVCVVGDKQAGTLRSGAISWVLTQHVFAFADTQLVEVEDGVDTRTPQAAVPIEHARVFEAPYIDVCATLPRAELAVLPDDVGYLLGVATRPEAGLDYSMHVEPDGGEYAQVAAGEWCPTATVVGAVPRGTAPVEVLLANASLLDRVQVGMPVLWDDEWGRLDAIDAEALTATIARACADTVPQPHLAGSRLWFVGDDVATDVTEYTDGETIAVKMLPSTGSQRLPIGEATALPLTFDGRQARPYPPADVRLNGASYPTVVVGDIEVTAAHRDRVLQSDQLVDQTVADVGPEPGTTYTVRNVDTTTEAETHYAAGITTWPYTVPSAGLVASNRLEVYSVRDGLESWQRFEIPFVVGAVLLAEDGTSITAEDGDPIIME